MRPSRSTVSVSARRCSAAAGPARKSSSSNTAVSVTRASAGRPRTQRRTSKGLPTSSKMRRT